MDIRERIELRIAHDLKVSIEIVRTEPLCQQLVDECMDELNPLPHLHNVN